MSKATRSIACAFLLLWVSASSALAHATIQPNEAVAGSFSRFVVRVPNESEKAATTKIKVSLPPMASVRFEPREGWNREEKVVEFVEPLEAFGQEITEGVGSVTWSGGEIAPGEFLEFGFSAAMPEEETTLTFKIIQTYSDGEVAKWTGAPDSESPASLLRTYDIGAEEGEGQLAVLARLAATQEEEPAGETPAPVETDETTDVAADDAEEADSPLPLILSGLALLASLAALVMASKKRDAHGTTSR